MFWWDLADLDGNFQFVPRLNEQRSAPRLNLPDSLPVVTRAAAFVDTPKQTQKHTPQHPDAHLYDVLSLSAAAVPASSRRGMKMSRCFDKTTRIMTRGNTDCLFHYFTI